MTRRVTFFKLHGLGNDFVLVDSRNTTPGHEVEDWGVLSRRLLDRRRGIGGDQLLLLGTTELSQAHCRLRFFNQDGSEAEMCGNGLRAVGLFLSRHRHLQGPISLDTLSGVRSVEPLSDGRFRVRMGRPSVQGLLRISMPDGSPLDVVSVNVGNPHAVAFLDHSSVDDYPLGNGFGAFVEKHPLFPKGTNFEICNLTPGADYTKVRVWERGAGITEACGSGACAVLAAALHVGRLPPGKSLRVELPGGALDLSMDHDQEIIMVGPAEEVFRGEVLI